MYTEVISKIAVRVVSGPQFAIQSGGKAYLVDLFELIVLGAPTLVYLLDLTKCAWSFKTRVLHTPLSPSLQDFQEAPWRRVALPGIFRPYTMCRNFSYLTRTGLLPSDAKATDAMIFASTIASLLHVRCYFAWVRFFQSL